MYLLNQLIEKRNSYIAMLKRFEKIQVDGFIEVHKKKTGVEFYHCKYDKETGNKIRTYICKDKSDLVKKLILKGIFKRLKPILHKRIKLLNQMIEEFSHDKVDQVFDELAEDKKAVIGGMAFTNKQKVKLWKEKSYQGKGFLDNDTFYITNSKIKVRSKSEKILADMFDSYGLVYKYEYPLKLGDGRVIYPDFTFLSPETGNKIYWEHFGMLDNPDYANQLIKKLESYNKQGIIQGENLILTFESSKNSLDFELARQLIKKHFNSKIDQVKM